MNKLITIIYWIIFLPSIAIGQNPLSQKVQTEFGIGICTPFLHGGFELKRSADIRSNGLSYFADEQGNRKNVGEYGNLVGWSVSVAYYLPLKEVKGLMLGSAVRTSLTGTQPKKGGYEEGYYFNFLSVGMAGKYYLTSKNNFFIKADIGLASVLTKNRFLNEQNQQNFFHQFGIGTNFSSGIGYSIQPFANNSKTIDLNLVYQFNAVRVEVNEIGNDQWKYSALSFIAAINF